MHKSIIICVRSVALFYTTVIILLSGIFFSNARANCCYSGNEQAGMSAYVEIIISLQNDATTNAVLSFEKDIQQNTTRCKAVTQKGTQCKRNASQGSDYCWQHQKIESKERCKAITKKGSRCTRKATTSDGYCTQHAKMKK